LSELLKQLQYEPVPVGEQVAELYAGINGYLDDVAVEDVKRFEKEFIAMLRAKHPNMLDSLSLEIKPDVEETLKRLLTTFKEKEFKPSAK
jgi:F-type H+-transporting ATPase subunit alpha